MQTQLVQAQEAAKQAQLQGAAAMAAGVPDGYELNTPEDFGRVMHRRHLGITVNQVLREGKKYASVKSFDRSRYPME